MPQETPFSRTISKGAKWKKPEWPRRHTIVSGWRFKLATPHDSVKRYISKASVSKAGQPTMQGKVCLVTGATSGIGLVTAHELARQGARVLLVGRNSARCAETIEQIRARTGNQDVKALLADLSSQRQIRDLARHVRGRYPRLDVLINNAGRMWLAREVTVDGLEMTFAVNHLAYFLLTHLLLDTLQASAPARVAIRRAPVRTP